METSDSVKIFIAYARTDIEYLQELKKYIRPLERKESVDFWYDGEIKPGEIWEAKIKKHLHEADIVLLLVSANSIASNYFYDKEVADALERHHNKEAIVIPIILKSCGWDLTPLGDLQALPQNGLPISRWDRDSDAYTNITHQLNERINTVLYEKQEDKIREEKEQRLLEETKAKEKAEREKRLKKEAAAKRKEEEQRIKKGTEAKERAAQTKNKEQKVANEKLVETNQFTSDKHNISESQSLLTIAENLFEKGMYRSALSKFEEAIVFDPNNANIDARITITRDKLNKSQKSTPNEMAKIGGGLIIAIIIFIILYGISIAVVGGW